MSKNKRWAKKEKTVLVEKWSYLCGNYPYSIKGKRGRNFFFTSSGNSQSN